MEGWTMQSKKEKKITHPDHGGDANCTARVAQKVKKLLFLQKKIEGKTKGQCGLLEKK